MDSIIDANKVGVALLVSIGYNSPSARISGLSPIPFTHDDTRNLKNLLEGLNYAVIRKKNVSAYRFVSWYKKLAEYPYPATCKRIILYVSSHGDDGILWMEDGTEVNICDVISSFRINVSGNISLAETAKLFIFDACRGSYSDRGRFIRKSKSDDGITCLGKVPKEGNMLIAYSSTRYYKSYGRTSTGSRWTNCFLKAVRESKEEDDVLHILTEANIIMRNEPNKSCYQTAEFLCSLADHVYFKKEAKLKK